jgi:hypothetical protein
MDTINIKKTGWSKKFIVIAVLGIFCVSMIGLLFRGCNYTEEEIPIPSQLSEGKIVVSKNAYIAVGLDDNYSCLPKMGNIQHYVVEPSSVIDINISRARYEHEGKTLVELPVGTVFYVDDILLVKNHGIAAIEGQIPVLFLLLRDEEGKRYYVGTASLGINEGDEFLHFVDKTGTYELTAGSFPIFVTKPGEFSFNVGKPVTQLSENSSFADYHSYYNSLQTTCRSICCSDSVEHMRKNSYTKLEGSCLEGYAQNRELCMESVIWCEPANKTDTP